MRRALIKPPLKMSFNDVYNAISKQPKSHIQELLTTGGVPFGEKGTVLIIFCHFELVEHLNK